MPVINLTREAGIKIGPVLLETLVKHYFERILRDDSRLNDLPQLRQDELLYDEAFNIVKAFLEASTKHTVEELQWFSNVRTPSPPWVHVVKVTVPISCCDEAATQLIKALGGEEVTKRIVGGTKWWQVRGVNGVDAEWVTTKKDWREARRRYKNQQKGRPSTSDGGPKSRPSTSDPSSNGHGGTRQDASENYQPEMDEMRCILYAHGGGYYFGSVDQERYSIQRHARKINGRVFAINYRLAPQYPFPCAIQDLLAAYLFLISPPEGSSHRKVNPAHIVVAGDSAGGGLCIALLQVIRDAGLPMPAGGVLISPWCDLTHSFPSIQTNTATDVLPPYGLSLYKPSTLWPPPPDELIIKVQATVRERVRQAIHLHSIHFGSKIPGRAPSTSPTERKTTTTIEEHFTAGASSCSPKAEDYSITLPPTNGRPSQELHLGSTASLPTPPPLPSTSQSNSNSGPTPGFTTQRVQCRTSDGKILTVDDQIQLYAPNGLLGHPLICPVASYLGGLPPLFVIASEKEVLRDEIIYLAHKAAYPEKYPVKDEARDLYPALKGIEERGYKPTKVHLQVYDDTAHVLPVLFSFTTPAKYCYRAIASFIKYTTGMLPPSSSSSSSLPAAPSGHILGNPTISVPFVDSPSNISETSNPMDKPTISRTRSLIVRDTRTRKTSQTEGSSTTSSGSVNIQPREESQTHLESQKARGGVRNVKQDGGSSTLSKRMSLRRAISATASRVSGILHHKSSGSMFLSPPPHPQRSISDSRLELSREVNAVVDGNGTVKGKERERSDDVAGPRFGLREESGRKGEGVRYAGEASVYDKGLDTMIRERVSTQGVIRPLEPESSLPAFALPHDLVGVISELAIQRYMDGRCKFDKKFKKTVKNIEKVRRRNLELANKDVERNITRFKMYMEQGEAGRGRGREMTLNAIPSKRSLSQDRERSRSRSKSKSRTRSQSRRRGPTSKGLTTSGSWSWAWALDADERPPASSIVSRRDTDEAVRLARIADQSVLMEENMISGNNLWSMIVNFLTVTPDKHQHSSSHQHRHKKHGHGQEKPLESTSASTPADTISTGERKEGVVDAGVGAKKLSLKESTSKVERFRSWFAQFVSEQRKFNFFNHKDTTTQQAVQA